MRIDEDFRRLQHGAELHSAHEGVAACSIYGTVSLCACDLIQPRPVSEQIGTRSFKRQQTALSEFPTSDQAQGQSNRRISSPYEGVSNGQYTASLSQTIPSISGLTQSPMPSPHLGTYPGADGMSQHSSMSRLVAALGNCECRQC